jgi:Sortase and related acyltransferases
MMKIRNATPADMEGVTLIYNDAVEHTTAIGTKQRLT